MIKHFKHRGLEQFYRAGCHAKICYQHVKRLRMILARLSAIHKPEDMDLPGFYFHALTGNKINYYSVRVNKNWRVIFQFDGIDVTNVDYVDYH